MVFKKNQVILFNKKKIVCIAADKQIAVFAKFIQRKDGSFITNYKHTFVFDNSGTIRVQYKTILANYKKR